MEGFESNIYFIKSVFFWPWHKCTVITMTINCAFIWLLKEPHSQSTVIFWEDTHGHASKIKENIIFLVKNENNLIRVLNLKTVTL